MKVLLAGEYGFCFGVERAVEIVEDALAEGNQERALGSLNHNEQELEHEQELERFGKFGALYGFAPFTANASISGRVVTANGFRIDKVIIKLNGTGSETIFAYSSSCGYYKFNNLPVGQTYVVTV
jgi:LytB protein